MIWDFIITLLGVSLEMIVLIIIFELSPVESSRRFWAYQIEIQNYKRNIGRSLTREESMDFSNDFAKWYYCRNWDLWLKS